MTASGAYIKPSQPVLKKIATASGAVDFNVLQNNGRIAHQEVDHVSCPTQNSRPLQFLPSRMHSNSIIGSLSLGKRRELPVFTLYECINTDYCRFPSRTRPRVWVFCGSPSSLTWTSLKLCLRKSSLECKRIARLLYNMRRGM